MDNYSVKNSGVLVCQKLLVCKLFQASLLPRATKQEWNNNSAQRPSCIKMSRQRSPLKARNINSSETSMRKQLGKKQLKRRSSLFGPSDFKEPPKKRLFDVYDDSLDSSFGDSYSQGNSFYSLSKHSASPKKNYVATLPMDLRLASKLRIVSGRPFPFSDLANNNSASCVSFNSSVIDEGCRLLGQFDFSDLRMPSLKNVCPLSILKSAGLYYQFPDIGFMQMFPRLDGVARSKGIRTSLLSFGNEVVDAVQTEWLKSFDHLYNSWKNGKRNSFYLCGPNFTVLFIKIFKPSDNSFDPEDTCMGFNDSLEHRVIITPTTCGFRKLLKSNDISFVLPLKCGEEIERENWMRGIGFSPSKIHLPPSESQDQFALAEDSGNASQTTNEGESTIAIVQMNAIDAFRKLMLDMHLGWAKTGQQAGLPPTILATDPFLNSALKSLNFKTQVLKKTDGTQYTLDVEDGPILPHVSILLHEFFRGCNNQLDDENSIKCYVNGRSICDGFNEATSKIYKNLNEFTFDGCKSRYFY